MFDYHYIFYDTHVTLHFPEQVSQSGCINDYQWITIGK